MQQAQALAAKLGCPSAVVTPGGGATNGAATAECEAPVPAGADQFNTTWHYDIDVFPDAAALAGYITQLRAAYNPDGLSGDRWAVGTGSGEDAALANAQAKVGGQQL